MAISFHGKSFGRADIIIHIDNEAKCICVKDRVDLHLLSNIFQLLLIENWIESRYKHDRHACVQRELNPY